MAVSMADITKLRKMTGAGTVSYTHLSIIWKCMEQVLPETVRMKAEVM